MSNIEINIAASKGSVIQYFQNLTTYSEQLDNAVHIKSTCFIIPDFATAPDGTFTADKMIPNNGSTYGGALYRSYSVTPLIGYEFSYHIKYENIRYAFFWLYSNGDFGVAEFDLLLGTVRLTKPQSGSGLAGFTYVIKKDRGGFYRIFVSGVAFVSILSPRLFFSDIPHTNEATGTPLYTGDGVKGNLVWGMQIKNDLNVIAYTKTETSIIELYSSSIENEIAIEIKESNIEIDTRN